MFFKQVWRNAAKNRKDSGLFFGTLVIAIVAFYTLLSLESQDVMKFLTTVESDAVRKLMLLLPAVYAVSLFFVYFLVYFACKYQLGSRKREFGMYLMLGMKRSRLFLMLFCENLWNSLISLFIGLPVALLLTEGISLATAKVVGLGILGHSVSFSMNAVLWTIGGYVLVQMMAMLRLAIPLAMQEPAQLLHYDAVENQTELSKAKSMVYFVLGILLLLLAYYLGIFRMSKMKLSTLATLLAAGLPGTLLLYRGMGGFLGRRIRAKNDAARGLETFTGRQVQENVVSQHKALAVSSLLLMMALSCVSYGFSVGIGRGESSRSCDFSLFGPDAEVAAVLEREDVARMTKAAYPMELSIIKWEEAEAVKLDLDDLANAVVSASDHQIFAESVHIDYTISLRSYNRLLRAMGKEELRLGEREVALFTSMGGRAPSDFDAAVKGGTTIGIDGETYTFYPTLCQDNVVADRAITLYMALIVPDALYREIARSLEPYCWNLHLTDEAVSELGLMPAVRNMDAVLAATGLEYDSYLGGIGRNLFYAVAASYLTVYLGILFLLIANAVIGLKYLISQRQNKHRYVTLAMLGASTEEMCRSVRRQIDIFFSLVLSVALVSSVAAVCTLFTSLTRLPVGTSPGTVALFAGVLLAFFALLEVLYIGVVKRTACREIRELNLAE